MFANEALTDFSIPVNRSALISAINDLQKRYLSAPIKVTPIINGSAINDRDSIYREDPSNPSSIIGQIGLATVEDCESALKSLKKGAQNWSRKHYKERADILRKIAAIMVKEKSSLTALIIKEAGKPWLDSDADVAEAIDFCNYYADEIERISTPKLTDTVPAEESFYSYRPRGICAVIAPWNFPLAILCGMAVAALAAGNTVAIKPAEQTSIIAHELFRIMLEAGVPSDAISFLPGVGEIIGKHLVNHPLTDMICFTGSQPVGLSIIRDAAQSSASRDGIKRVIAELGGKNAIIIDSDADIDEAISGVLVSAFGYAGQKCSACSRLIIVGDLYEEFLHRLSEATRDFPVGIASDPATVLGPVIDSEAQQRILKTIALGEKECNLLFKGEVPEDGYFVPPTIFKDVKNSSSIWREEIFGPVIAATKASSFEEAIALANDCKYALTGGVYSRLPSHIEQAREEFEAGNLYINRKITGALVKRHPFGGFKMSGIGSKAGGPDYLIQFMEPKVVTENTMRRGFAS